MTRAMFFTSAVVFAVVLLTDHAQGKASCDACRFAVDKIRERLQEEVTKQFCRMVVNLEDESDEETLCKNLAKATNDITSNLMPSKDICKNLGFCWDPPPHNPSMYNCKNRGFCFGPPPFNPLEDALEAVGDIAKGTIKAVGRFAGNVGKAVLENEGTGVPPVGAMVVLGAIGVFLLHWSPAVLVFGRRKRDISSTEMALRLAGIYDEEEYDKFRNLDNPPNAVHDLSERLDANMTAVEVKLMCDVCKLRKYLDPSITNVSNGEGRSEGMILCRALPSKRDQRKCIKDLRQIIETIRSIFGPAESCQFLSCVAE